MFITDSIFYVGVNDHQVDLFEGQYDVPNGMAYNSYVIMDEKITVMDTVDAHFTEEWLGNIAKVLDGKKPSYLVVQHMEPDHAANIHNFMKAYPETTVVANAKTFGMMNNFFPDMELGDQKLEVKNGESLSLGTHTLTFVFAPMVHWPEVMVTYESTEKVLFSARWVRQIRCFGCGRRLGLRSSSLLYRYCRQVRRTGTDSFKESSSSGYPDNLPAARTGSDGRSGTLH